MSDRKEERNWRKMEESNWGYDKGRKGKEVKSINYDSCVCVLGKLVLTQLAGCDIN